MNSVTRFIIGSVVTFAVLIFVSLTYFSLPIESTLIMSFLVVSSLVGILFALKSRVHSGHSVLVFGIVILAVSFVIVSGGIDITVGSEIKQKLWDIPSYLFTQLLFVMGIGFLLVFVGLHVTWRRR